MPSNHQPDFLNTPNLLSLSRIASVPLLILMLLSPGEVLSLIAAIIFLAVCLTDWLDGYLARKRHEVTTLGKFLDPRADKLVIITALVMLIPLERAPAWMVALIIAREVTITGLRTIALEQGKVIAASPAGKSKTVAQIAAIVPLIVHYPFFGINFHAIGTFILWIAFILTLYSGFEYFKKFFAAETAALLDHVRPGKGEDDKGKVKAEDKGKAHGGD